MKIVILDRNSLGMDIDLTMFGDFGTYEEHDVADRADCKKWIADAEVIVFNKTRMDEDMLQHAPKVKLLCITATGFDNIDVEYCKRRGIGVANVRGYSTPAVAQHTFTLALYLLEKIGYYDNYVKSGAYCKQLGFSNFDRVYTELEGKTWGIVGLGNIGTKVAEIATVFGCKVIYYSASGSHDSATYERVDFPTLLAQSDFISIHCPLSDRTRNLFEENAFRAMKKSAIVINVARGPVVNDQDLYEALVSGEIAAAGLDVLGVEPMEESNPLGKIKDSEKLLITPHMAWASVEARTRCAEEIYKNIQAFLNKEARNRLDIE
ncbi:MAG: D-2-hydroxyacid dehydrogenase [Lachnospiraceae bacterium]|nr:D-2-hydroxyacid dehydrogenase [Lachnospiraceae bacterium]